MPSPIVLNGQVGLQASRQQLAAAGKYFVATNPTEATGIQYGLQAAFSATANGLFSISNNNPVGGAVIHLDELRLSMLGTAPATTTSMRFGFYSETGIVALTTLVLARVPVNVNSSYANTTGAVVTSYAAGAGTVPAAVGTRRFLGTATIPTSLGITGDEYVVQFGGDSLAGANALTAVRATAASRIAASAPPIAIAPGNSAYINMYWLTATTTAPTFEFSLSYAEV